MKSSLVSLGLAGLASAAVLEYRDYRTCGTDNCGRQVMATRPGAVAASVRSADCVDAVVSYATVTVTPTTTVATVTNTASVTTDITVSTSTTVVESTTVTLVSTLTETDVNTQFSTSTYTPNVQGAVKRDVPTSVPAYASSCTKPGAYASACSCLLGSDLPTSTSTITITASAVPDTLTASATATQTETAFETLVFTSTRSDSTTEFTTATVETTTTTTLVCTATVPSVALASPTGVMPGFNGYAADDDYDNQYWELTIPFPITVHDMSSIRVAVAVNGGLFLEGWDPIKPVIFPFQQQQLPVYFPTYGSIPDYTVVPFWSDLFINKNTSQGLYYEVDGTEGQRTITFEWYASHWNHPSMLYDFTITFYEAQPGAWTAKYYQVFDQGLGATVGMQSQAPDGPWAQYSNSQTVIFPGLVLHYDPATNTFGTSC